jgi:hypothetical protein
MDQAETDVVDGSPMEVVTSEENQVWVILGDFNISSQVTIVNDC